MRHAFLIVVAVGFGLGFIGLLASGDAAPAGEPNGAPTVASPAAAEPVPTETPVPAALPSPPPVDVGTADPPTLSADRSWLIAIDARGYQAELDACLWVRMDLGVTPIVGAHTSCGGSVVLDMVDLDAVELVGQELDGIYVVTGSRDARAGDPAAAATDGLVADVILQTCYPGGDGRVRLVSLTRTESATPET